MGKRLPRGWIAHRLRELAGLSRGEYREARELLDQVVDELGLPELPDDDQAVWEVVVSLRDVWCPGPSRRWMARMPSPPMPDL